MAKVPFKYYLHDNYTTSERADEIAQATGLSDEYEDIIQEAAKRRPFLEVTLHCELDTETGDVTIVSASTW